MPNYDAIINGYPVTIYASVKGKHYPSTQFEPEEFPEVEINGVEYDGQALPEHFFPLLDQELTRIEREIECGDIQPQGADKLWN
jgi:hypothetical protein